MRKERNNLGYVSEAINNVANAITESFNSPNVSDSNWEPANIVDVLERIAVRLEHFNKLYEENMTYQFKKDSEL